MYQLVQIGGALLILIAFAGAQFGAMSPRSRAYLGLNLGGSLVLAWLAWRERQWGFLLLESSWAAISLHGIARSGGRGAASSGA